MQDPGRGLCVGPQWSSLQHEDRPPLGTSQGLTGQLCEEVPLVAWLSGPLSATGLVQCGWEESEAVGGLSGFCRATLPLPR